jgi:parallel beta-helix repeat protein
MVAAARSGRLGRGGTLAVAFTLAWLAATASSAGTISGTVFEDRNYGGGAGRSLAASGGSLVANARVELYSSAGNFLASTTTNASGFYSFTRNAGTYTVRVPNLTVASTRSGSCAAGTCIPVQTFRTDASSGAAVAVTDRVGGQLPQSADAGNGSGGGSLSAGAQSITTVFLAANSSVVTGVDFGFNFDTIVNTNNSGQGSLRQFITNANTLTGEGSLAQVGQTAGRETSIFMIPNGIANPGQNTGYTNQLTTAGANAGSARITLTSALPAITGTSTTLDGFTQTANVRATPGGAETNPGQVGTGGTVGTSAIPLPRFERPEIVINSAANQLSATGTSVIIRGVAIENGSVAVSGSSNELRDALVGMRADGTVGTTYGAQYGVTLGAGTGITVSHVYVKVNNSGIRGDAAGANAVVEYCEVDSITGAPGGGHTNTFDGILFINSATNITVRYNLSKNQRGGGLEFGFGAGSITGTVTENTLTTNGYTSAGVPSTEALNVAFYSLGGATAMTFSNNVVSAAGGPGVIVENASGIVLTQNSIFGNGVATGLGIDLDSRGVDPNGYMPPEGPTLNDSGDGDTGPNGLLNYPILQTALINGGNLELRGWARAGSLIEVFLAAADPSGFGEGQTYLFTATEGSGADGDATSSTYGPGAINGVAQGTDTTTRFAFVVPTPGGVAVGSRLTATARLAGNTSEFSGLVTVTGMPSYTVVKTSTAISDPANCTTPGSSASCSPPGSQKRIPGAIVEYQVTTSNAGGAADADSIVVTDPIPASTDLRVADIGAAGSGPVGFIDGATASGLSYTFASLASAADDVSFSNDGGATWTYTPTPGADGCDAAVTNVRINPKGTFAADSGTPDPSFTLRYRVCVE